MTQVKNRFAESRRIDPVNPPVDAAKPQGMALFPVAEQGVCFQCDAHIPTENITAAIDRRTGIQTVTGRCENCQTEHAMQRQLCGGMWQIVGGTSVRRVSPRRAARTLTAGRRLVST